MDEYLVEYIIEYIEIEQKDLAEIVDDVKSSPDKREKAQKKLGLLENIRFNLASYL